MTNPLKLRKNANGVYTDGLQVMSDTELKYAASIVLAKFGSTTQDVGDIIFDTDIGDSIGTFVDQYANGELSSHPADTNLLSTTYTLYQNTSAASESSMTVPAKLDAASFVKPQSDTDLNDSIIQTCLSKLAAANSTFGEAGTYYIASNTSLLPGGTWSAVSTIYDEVTNNANDDDEKVAYSLYRRTNVSESGDSADIPITVDSATPSHLKEMTTAQLQSLAERLRNRIIATGIGTYALQQTAPSTGTWVSRGTITDRVPTINNVTYSRNDQYTRIFSAQYTRSSVGYAREYNTSPNVYVRSVYGSGNFTSTRFTRIYSGNYTRNTIGPAYTALYQGSVYTRQVLSQNYISAYSRGAALTAGETTALQQYAADWSVTGDRQYIRSLGGVNTAVTFQGQYAREAGKAYQRAVYNRLVTGPSYHRNIQSYSVTEYQRQFQRTFSGQYTRIRAGLDYVRAYTRIYTGNYTVNYAGVYSRGFVRNFTRSVTGPAYIRGQFTRAAIGPSYTRAYYRGDFAGSYFNQYLRTTFSGQYISRFSGTPSYTNQFLRNGYSDGDNQYARVGAYERVNIEPYSLDYRTYYRSEASVYAGGTTAQTYKVEYARAVVYNRQLRDVNSYINNVGPLTYRYDRAVAYFNSYNRTGFQRAVPGPGYSPGQYNRYPGEPYPSYTIFYTRTAEGPTYAPLYARSYNAVYSSNTLAYTRFIPGANYSRGIAYTRIFSGQYTGSYTRIFSAQYIGQQFIGSEYLYSANPGAPEYARVGPAYGSGPLYSRLIYTRIVIGPQYSRGTTYQRFYTGPQYTRATVGPQYNGPVYANVQLNTTTGSYVRTYTGSYAGLYAQQFSRSFSANYTRAVVGPQYASDFDVYARAYSGQYLRQTVGPQYTREFTGNTVRPANEVAFTEVSTTLWLRVA